MDVDVAGEHPVPSRNPTVQELSQEAESLVYQLNHPTHAIKNKIPAIQERLQQIQRLPQGWDVARYLLDHPDSGTKFFGALSFIIKINQSWTDLSDDDIKSLKSYLVSCYVTLIETKERRLVTRKSESAIVAAFLHDSSWSRPLLDLAAFFWRHGQESFSGKDLTGTILPSLTEVQISGLLSFALTLAEDSIRSSDLTRKDSGNHPITESIDDAFSICHYVLGELLNQARTESEVNEKTGYEVLESCRAWLNLRNSIYFKERNDSPIIQNTVERILLCMEIESLSDQATMVVADMLTNGDTELKEEHLLFILNYLQGSHGKELVQMLVDGDYDDRAMAFWALLEAYTARKRVGIITESLEPSHAVLATYLDLLFQAPGYPGVEDVISPQLLEWWTETADSLLDGVEQGLENAHQQIAKAVLNVYNRLQLPPDEEFDLWTPDERSEFHNFRRDTKDFLLSIYATLGMELFGLFRQKAVAALEVEDWKELEAACFCLAQLSEAADDKQAAYDHLNAIFTSDTFTQICYNSKQISVKTRQTLVDMLGLYETFFEHNPGHLPKVLTFLFSSLNIEACTKNASRSIQFLCKSCRKALTGELPVFLRICNEFQQSQAMTTQSLERVLEGIAAVVQALPTEEAKAPIIEELLRPFLAQSVSARDDAIRGDIDSAHSRGQMAVKCIAGIGRGLRTDESKVIDLEKEDSATKDNNTFWYGHPLQEQLYQCIFLYLDSFPLEHEIIEGICDILKAGFTETIGLYVFRPAVTARILTAIPLKAAAASDTVMSTASSFLASHQGNPQLIREEAISLFMHVYWAFSFMMDNPENHDPEVSNSGISFLTRSLPMYHEILFSLTSPPAIPDNFAAPPSVDMQSPVLQRILNFVSLALSGREPLPLRSAAQFWVGVLTLPTATNTGSNVSRAIQEYLPGLCHVLMTQLSGGCARSDIHYFCDVLRKIIFNFQGEARKHLAASLALVNSSKNRASPPPATLLKESDRFLAMLLSARGGPATLEIVRAHWINCRGAAFSYLV